MSVTWVSTVAPVVAPAPKKLFPFIVPFTWSGYDGFENRKEDWVGIFVIGDENNSVFEIDFNNELNSCLVIREDNEYFNRDFDLDLLEEVEGKYIW